MCLDIINFTNFMAPCFNNINLRNPIGYATHHQVNIQQLYALPTLKFCVLNYLRTDLCHAIN
jgi:hypothetical protein